MNAPTNCRASWGPLAAVVVGLAALCAPAAAGAAGPISFGVSMKEQTYTVPSGVRSVHVLAEGGKGGDSGSAVGGVGGAIDADLPVIPGEVLHVEVPAPGSGVAFDGHGGSLGSVGGAASDVRTVCEPAVSNGCTANPLDSLRSRLIVAPGGGGAGDGTFGGNGGGGGGGSDFTVGGATGQSGINGADGSVGTGGQGGGSIEGGAGGSCSPSPSTCSFTAQTGGIGAGGNGGGGGSNLPGGGGGGGYFGGGGGGGSDLTGKASSGGGGGGSSFVTKQASGVQFGPAGPARVLIIPAARKSPSASRLSLTGVGKRKPRLRFTVAAASGGKSLKKISISFPKGFQLNKQTPGKRLSVRDADGKKLKYKASVRGRTLTITLRMGAGTVRLSLASPGLTDTRAEARKVRRHKVGKVTLKLVITDNARTVTTLKPRVGVR